MRHGETEWNAAKRAQGQADVPLNERGRQQAAAAADDLAVHQVAAVYSSDLSRAIDTAALIARVHEVDVVTDPDLREIDQGEWEGLTTAEIKSRWPHLWGPARHYRARPGGESPQQVRRRALAALKRVVDRYPGETVVVVSHGGTIRWISAEALGYDDRGSVRVRGLSNGGGVAVEGRLEKGNLRLANLIRLDGFAADSDDPNQ